MPQQNDQITLRIAFEAHKGGTLTLTANILKMRIDHLFEEVFGLGEAGIDFALGPVTKQHAPNVLAEISQFHP